MINNGMGTEKQSLQKLLPAEHSGKESGARRQHFSSAVTNSEHNFKNTVKLNGAVLKRHARQI